ncbi:hypothetical protein V1291_004463 [Nitrobacteraceae bacterium AZCC 1564]
MVIEECQAVANYSAASAWASVQRFHNVAHVTSSIMKLHSVDEKHKENARKQAQQIRYCLMQAREYFGACASVSLATQPTLLYYSIMSLALAEILLKHTGASSLDKARENNRHHGLVFENQAGRRPSNLIDAASRLRARPLLTSTNVRSGTFDLWHQSAREMPIVGRHQNNHKGQGSIESTQIILTASDERLPLLPVEGVSLLDCFQNLPGMYDFLLTSRLQPQMLRGVPSSESDADSDEHTCSIVIQPTAQPAEFFGNIEMCAWFVDRVNLKQFPGGGVFTVKMSDMDRQQDLSKLHIKVPPGSCWTTGETRFWPNTRPLNEFGYLYVALFIVGNYARYFPDMWLLDVEQATPLALAIEELLRIASERMVWCAVSELDRCYFVPVA